MKRLSAEEAIALTRVHNFGVIYKAGLNHVESVNLGHPVESDLSQLLLKTGRIIQQPRLSMRMSDRLSFLLLEDYDNNQTMSDCTLRASQLSTPSILQVVLTFNTYEDFEGAGFARALFFLGDLLAPKLAEQCSQNMNFDTAIAVVEDTSHRRGLDRRTGWTTAHALQLGYSNNPDFLKQFGLQFNTRKMLVKLI